jgi:1A family penicillin-binding protein
LSAISDQLEHAVIANEDHDFYSHGAISFKGIAAAAYADLVNNSATKYGGSTLTQQLVKNKLLTSKKNFFRKYQEISMAVAVEKHYTKQEILDMYLNSVYFGEGSFGVSDAARTYFGKKPSQLDLAESSMLAGLLPAPSAYSPISGDRTLAKDQQERVLKHMAENGYITESQRKDAEDESLDYTANVPGAKDTYAQHFAMMVVDRLKAKYGEERITRSGFEVTTTLDSSWQLQAEKTVKQRVAVMAGRGGRNASLVAIDPTNGQVRALVGSVDWDNSSFGQVNMATTPRQPGSSFKPIYYSKAFDDHLITPATILDDTRTTFGGTYTPQNVDHEYLGKMTVREALARSRNIPAVEVMQKLGVVNGVQAAQEMGLDSVNNPNKYGLSLAVGTAEVSLLKMTSAYSAFADKGELHQPIFITAIKDKTGKTVFKAKDSKKRVRSAEASFLLSSILADNAARAPLYGSALNVFGRQVAVKTGTTNDNVDAWTIGYSPQITVGVWVGNNEHRPMVGLAGGSAAGSIWRPVITNFLRGKPAVRFQQPKNVILLSICTDSISYSEYFIKGTEPSEPCHITPRVKETPKKTEDNQGQNGNNGQGNDDGIPEPTPPIPEPTTPPEPPPQPDPGDGEPGTGGDPPGQTPGDNGRPTATP